MMRDYAFRFGPAVLLIALTIFFLMTAQQYSVRNRTFPVAVAGLTLLILALELLSQTNTAIGRRLRTIFSGSPDSNMPKVGGNVTPIREIAAVAWVVAFFGMTLYLGFYIAIPVYVVAYLYLYAGKGLVPSVLLGGGLVAFLYAVFKLLLGYEIYRGLLFGAYI